MSKKENPTNPLINYKFLFNVLPTPVIVVDRVGCVVEYNLSAEDIFADLGMGGKIDDLFSDKRKIRSTLLELLQFHKVMSDVAMLRINTNQVYPYEYKVTILSEVNELFLFQFTDLRSKNDMFKLEIEHTFFAEINSLKPYLNKTGKELVEKKASENTLSSIFDKELGKQQIDSFTNNESFIALSNNLPQLSKNELKVAFLLSLGAGIEQISKFNSKNENAIRVMIHRMSLKLKVSNTKELIKLISANCTR